MKILLNLTIALVALTGPVSCALLCWMVGV